MVQMAKLSGVLSTLRVSVDEFQAEILVGKAVNSMQVSQSI